MKTNAKLLFAGFAAWRAKAVCRQCGPSSKWSRLPGNTISRKDAKLAKKTKKKQQDCPDDSIRGWRISILRSARVPDP
jgi:hypothetical protein